MAIGNDDLRKALEVALVLVEQSKQETQESAAIKRVVREIGPALQFLEDHPGPPVSVLSVPQRPGGGGNR